jgi:hypothetical protein
MYHARSLNKRVESMMTISATAPGGDMGPDPMAKRDEDGAGWPKQYRKGFLSLQ